LFIKAQGLLREFPGIVLVLVAKLGQLGLDGGHSAHLIYLFKGQGKQDNAHYKSEEDDREAHVAEEDGI
jgi:hypothetical protein